MEKTRLRPFAKLASALALAVLALSACASLAFADGAPSIKNVTLESDSVTIQAVQCPLCDEIHGQALVGYAIEWDGEAADDYFFAVDEEEAPVAVELSEDGTLAIIPLIVNEGHEISDTVTLRVVQDDTCLFEVDIDVTIVDLGAPEFEYGAVAVIDAAKAAKLPVVALDGEDGVLVANEALAVVADYHGPVDTAISEVASSDGRIVDVEQTEVLADGLGGDSFALVGMANGTACIEIEDVFGNGYSVEVTCKNFGEWQKDARGWWYRHADGSFPKDCWEQIGGEWYLFDSEGYMLTGWQKFGGAWYFLDNKGAMLTGWQSLGGSWYYLTPSGEMAVGWYNVAGAWYFFADSGIMQTGWLKSGGSWYVLGTDGAMLTGWHKSGSKWYWLDEESGAMVTGWQKVGGSWFFLADDGAMCTGWQKSGGAWYLLGSNGAMLTGWQKSGNAWYWLDEESGAMAANGWKQIDGEWYRFDANGAMLTGWQKDGTKWYWLDPNGAMASDRWVGDYYVLSDGHMATNQWIGKCYVGADGKWIPNYTGSTPGTVYWAPGASVYHVTKDCSELKGAGNVLSGSVSDAHAEGKATACSVCA